MVPSRCARHEFLVLFLRMFEAGISPEGFRGNGAGPAQVVQAVRAGVDTYVARFNQRAKFLPELPVSEKLKIIKRNIRPYYQNKIWDNEVNSIDRLLDLCDSIGKTKLNIEKFQPHSVTPPEPKLVKCFSC
jgi:hypothetical protein